MPSSLKRRVAIAVTVVAAAAFGGGAYAATRDSAANGRQAFLNDVAKRLHVTPKQLTAAVQGAAIDQLNAAVASGRLSRAQANALKQRIGKGGMLPMPLRPALGIPLGPALGIPLGLALGIPLGPPPGGLVPFRGRPPLPGPRFFGAPGHLGGPLGGPGLLRRRGAGALGAAASYLGVTEGQLLRQLYSGKSLAQIAKARGKSADGLKAAITASIKARLDKAVAAKAITSAQEQQILSLITSKLRVLVDRNWPAFAVRIPGKGMPIPAKALAAPTGGWWGPPAYGPAAGGAKPMRPAP